MVNIIKYIYNNTILDINALTETYQERILKYFNNDKNFIKNFLKYLQKIKDYDPLLFEKLVNCGCRDVYLTCGDHYFIVRNRCNSKFCPFCSKSKSLKYRRILKRFLKNKIENLPLRFLTLTWKNTSYLNSDLRKKYSNNFKAFKKRLSRYGYKIIKGIKTLEIKYNNDTGYNCHLHLLFYAKYKVKRKYLNKHSYFSRDGWIDVRFLRKIWKEITEDSHILNFQRIRKGYRGGVNYLCKYITKSDNIYNINKIIEYDAFSRKLRVIEKFGYKDKISDCGFYYCCPICKKRVSLVLDEVSPQLLNIPLLAVAKKDYKGGL